MSVELDQQCINTLRFLSVDMIQKTNSGYQGLPLGAAAMAYVLWMRWLSYTRKTRTGSIATASYSRPGMVRRCSTVSRN